VTALGIRACPPTDRDAIRRIAFEIRFFEACGFVRHGAPHPAPGFRTREGRRRMHVQWMVRACPS
jgi:hypothetical protein